MSAGDDPAAPLQIDVVRGAPTEEELAAVIAVVSEAYTREEEAATVADESLNVWEVSARHLRKPLRRELGWRNYTGV